MRKKFHVTYTQKTLNHQKKENLSKLQLFCVKNFPKVKKEAIINAFYFWYSSNTVNSSLLVS